MDLMFKTVRGRMPEWPYAQHNESFNLPFSRRSRLFSARPVPAPQLMGLQLQTALIVTDDVSTTRKSDDLSPNVLFNFEFQCGDRLQGRDSKSLTGT